MKLFLLLTALLLVVAFSVNAEALPVPVENLGWLNSLVGFIFGVPTFQAVATKIVAVAGALSGGLTALSICLETVLKVPELVARWSGAKDFESKVVTFRAKVLPLVKWLSMFNVQKAKK